MLHFAWLAPKAWGLAKAVIPYLAPEVKARLDSRRKRKVFEKDVVRAFDEFASDPAFRGNAPLFFDKDFLREGAAPILGRFLNQRGELTGADELANLWLERYRMPAEKLPEAQRAAEAFLKYLAKNLKASDLFATLFDQSALDRTAAAAESILSEQRKYDLYLRHKDAVTNLKLMLAAARKHREAARYRNSGSDSASLGEDAEALHTEAMMGLRAAQFVQTSLVRDEYDNLVRARYETLCEVLDSGKSATYELEELEDGYLRLEAFLAQLAGSIPARPPD